MKGEEWMCVLSLILFTSISPPRAVKCLFDSDEICKFILIQPGELIGLSWVLSCASLLQECWL